MTTTHHHVGMATPWGRADEVITVCEGIERIETEGHGGYYLYPAMWEQMPAAWRETPCSYGGFYEEDCDWALVVLRFPFVFMQWNPLYFEIALESVAYLDEELTAGIEELRAAGSDCVRAWAMIPQFAHLA